MLVRVGFKPSEIKCHRHKLGLNTFAACRVSHERQDAAAWLTSRRGYVAEIDRDPRARSISTPSTASRAGSPRCATRGGRLFVLGVGGSAGHASHAVNDFRKLCGIEAYAPTDNVSELTARINDEGWDTSLAGWLEVSRLRAARCAARVLGRRRRRRAQHLAEPRPGARARAGGRRRGVRHRRPRRRPHRPDRRRRGRDPAAATPTASRRTPRDCAPSSGTCSSPTRAPAAGDEVGERAATSGRT